MQIPLSFKPAFIGRLIEAARAYKASNPPVWHRLCTLVDQLREFNGMGRREQEEFWPLIQSSFEGLTSLGVKV